MNTAKICIMGTIIMYLCFVIVTGIMIGRRSKKSAEGFYLGGRGMGPLVTAMTLEEDAQIALYSSDGRAAIFSTAQLLPKTTRNTQGVAVMTLKKKAVLQNAVLLENSGITNPGRYRTKTIPSAGMLLKEEDSGDKQQSFEV